MDEKQKSVLMGLGQRLKAARLERNDSQKTFAYRIGISIPTLHKMETGSPKVAMVTWVRALELLGRLHELESLLAPKKSLADRYASYQKIQGRQRAGKRKK